MCFFSKCGIVSFVARYLVVILLRGTFKHGRHDVVGGGGCGVVTAVSSAVRCFALREHQRDEDVIEERHLWTSQTIQGYIYRIL